MVDGGTPNNGILLLAFIAESGVPPVATFAGYGQTWTLVGRTADNAVGLYACITSAATSAAPVTTDTGSPTGMILDVIEVTGAYVSGTVLDAFEQQTAGVYIAEAVDISGTATSLSITLKAPDNAANRPFSVFHHVVAQNKTPRASWTELSDHGHTNPAKNLEMQYRSDTHETTASASWLTGAGCRGLAVTIREASAPPGGSTEQFFPVVVGA